MGIIHFIVMMMGKWIIINKSDVKDNSVETSINSDEGQEWEEEEDNVEEEEKEENDMEDKVEDVVATKNKDNGDKVLVEMKDVDDFVAAMNHYKT